ncbi:MAG: ribonuclease Z [Anaerolineae bacterium]|jgi:ribonuclease Z|nr:ribonuclease Z [Anaerolineae bacterium]
MIELILLGTAASAPSIQRGLPSQVVLYRDQRFLVDCGEGTQRQILRSGLGFRRLQRVLLTHGHLDHILGLGGLISTFARWEAVEHLEIYGGRWALERVNDLLFRVVLRGARPPVPIDFVDIRPGLLLEDENFEIWAFPVVHRGPGCYGYLFREKPHRPFLAEKAEALGVPAGPERRYLVNGESVRLADGRVIQPDEVLGPSRPGISVAITGDLSRVDNLVEAVQGVDLLVCESTYLARDAEMASQFGHLTAAQAAWLAREAGARMLVLTHLSQRYRWREIMGEAQAIFPETVIARDFDHFRVTRERIDLLNEELKDDEVLLESPQLDGTPSLD